MADLNEVLLRITEKVLDKSIKHGHNQDDQVIAALQRIERRQLFMVEALRALLRGQPDEATVAALTAKLNAEAEKIETAVEAQTP